MCAREREEAWGQESAGNHYSKMWLLSPFYGHHTKKPKHTERHTSHALCGCVVPMADKGVTVCVLACGGFISQ